MHTVIWKDDKAMNGGFFVELMNRSTPGLPVHHQLPESTQTHVH